MALGPYTQPESFAPKSSPFLEWASLKSRCLEKRTPEEHYRWMRQMGLEYGPSFQRIAELYGGERTALAKIQLPEGLHAEAEICHIHPVMLDACFQVMAAAAYGLDGVGQKGKVFVPAGISRIRLFRKPQEVMWCYAEVSTDARVGEAAIMGDLYLFDEGGEPLGHLADFEAVSLDRAGQAKKISDFFYEVDWHPVPIQPVPEEWDATGWWVILKDGRGVGDRLAEILKRRGGNVVDLGQEAGEKLPARWREVVERAGADPIRVLHMWTLDLPEHVAPARLEETQRLGTGSALTLIKSLLKHPPKNAKVWFVTGGAQAKEDGPIRIASSPVWGFARAFSVAHPNLWGGLLDVDPTQSEADRANSILTEIAQLDGEDQILYRRGQRYAARLERKALTVKHGPSLSFRPDASYLITGGLGELGLELAKWMVRQGARRLILTGRTPLPPRSEWSRVPNDPRISQRIEAVKQLEAMGASVHLAFFDLADEPSLRRFVDNYREEGWPPIRGVFHLAGVVENLAFEEMEFADVWKVYRPKLLGAAWLDELFPPGTLDCFVLFSSFTSILSPPRLAGYAGANAFLDALAKKRNRMCPDAVSIAWGPWAEAGMAVRTPHEKLASSSTTAGMNQLSLETGMEALKQICDHPSAVVAVADVDWLEWAKLYPFAGQIKLLQGLLGDTENEEAETENPSGSEWRNKWEKATPAKKRAVLGEYLRVLVARVMRFDPQEVPAGQPLTQLGLDSMMAVELRNRIEKDLRFTLPMVTFLQGPSLNELIERLDEGLSEQEPNMQENWEPVEKREYPLSYGQRSLWFLHQVAPESAAYHVGIAFAIQSPIDSEAFRRALERLVWRHPPLRTTYRVMDGEPMQQVRDPADLPLFQVEANGWSEMELREQMDQDYRKPFDLEKGPVWRGYLYRRAADDIVFLLVVHHIAIDFWGIEILLDELRLLYSAECSGEEANLPPLPAHYADFVRWQSRLLDGKVGRNQRDYWHRQLAGELPELQLPTDFPRPKRPKYLGASLPFKLDRGLTERLKCLAKQESTTLFPLLLAGFQVLLHRYSGQTDIIVGSPVTGRSRPEFSGLLGDFINMLPYRADFSGNPSFRAFLRQVKATVLAGLEHQDYPFPLMVEELQPQRDTGRSPVFQVAFILQNLHRLEGMAPFMVPGETEARLRFGDLTIRPFPIAQQEGQLDLTLEMAEVDGDLIGVWKYSIDLFAPETVARMAAHFSEVLRQVLEEPDRPVQQVSPLTEAERERVLSEWQGAKSEFPNALMHQLVEQQARRTPDAVAVQFEGGRWTYRELDGRANQLAHFLCKKGIGPGRMVAICVDRSMEMLVALLGVLKTGAAYVPLDPAFPKQRLEWMLEDSGAPVLLTQARVLPLLPEGSYEAICLDRDWDGVSRESMVPLPPSASLADRAYVIFTSGSTGRPKGVEISHRSVVNFLLAMQKQLSFSAQDRLVAVTTLSFDIAVLELFLPLAAGAQVVIASRETAMDGQKLAACLEETDATVMQATPATWRLLIESGWQGKKNLRMLCGGEALPKELAEQLLSVGSSLWNLYGPTEATIWMACDRIGHGNGPITIGKPIDNLEAYILDEGRQPVPVGVVGELYIGGIGLAIGYLNRPDLTAERFIPHPFNPEGAAKLYRSGDLARYLPDGRIQCLGRVDHQVKIRGYRIELGDIEYALSRHPAIRQNVVVAREDIPREKRLVAYYVADGDIPTMELRRFLSETLPDYMIPSLWMRLGELPLTPNGKVDRKALPAPRVERPETAQDDVAPRSGLEQTIARIWAEVLHVERVGVKENFFELGGTSLLAAKAHRLLTEQTGRNLTLIDLFQYPTIEALARHLAGDQGKGQAADRSEQMEKGKNRLAERLRKRKSLNSSGR
ncbi:amino acid adenylation domain-containing protein [Laceyella putida]|uniref:Amino acid adenylation domain-containing protein n=1 Tax=Laceyella putida TaxID=110101 RepID=A0ABW2RHS5_9BACL